MTITTLEKIHSLLQHDVKTRETALIFARDLFDSRQSDLEKIAATVDSRTDPGFVSAARTAASAKAVYDRARSGYDEAADALAEFESQDFLTTRSRETIPA